MIKSDTRSKEELLRLLYNLKSTDSCILQKIEEEKKELEIKRAGVEQSKLQANEVYLSLKKDEECASKGLGYAEEFFNFYEDNESLRHYFQLLNVDFDPRAAKDAVIQEKKSKTLVKSIDSKLKEEASKIDSLSKEQADLESKIDEAEDNLRDYEHTRLGVESLVSDVLNGNNSYNRDYVENILSKISSYYPSLGFNKEEIISTGIMILFPEQGLTDFDEKFKSGKVDITIKAEEEKEEEPVKEEEAPAEDIFIQNITNTAPKSEVVEEESQPVIVEEDNESGIFNDIVTPVEEEIVLEPTIPVVEEEEEETKEEAVEETEEPVEEAPTEETESIYKSDSPADTIIPIINQPEEEPVEEEKEEEKPVVKTSDEDLEKALAEMHIDLDKFESHDTAVSILGSADLDLVKRNAEELDILGASEKAIYLITDNGYMHLTDPELSQKINYLRSKVLKDESIKKLVDGNLFADVLLEGLKERTEEIEKSGKKLGEDNYVLLKYNPKNLEDSISILASMDMEPDEKEELYYAPVLAKNNKYVASDTEILKDYGISIYRRNGKHEFGIYWKNPVELLNSIDDIIEIGEEDLLDSAPEALAVNSGSVIAKIKFCRDNNIEYYDESDGKSYQGFIYKIGTFASEFDNPTLEDVIHREETNRFIKDEGSRSSNVEMLVESLKTYYNGLTEYKAITLEDNEIDVFDKVKNTLEEELKAELVDRNTYLLADEYISRNKFERNASYLIKELIKSNQEPDNMINEIIYVSLLFNSRKSEESVKKISKKVLG